MRAEKGFSRPLRGFSHTLRATWDLSHRGEGNTPFIHSHPLSFTTHLWNQQHIITPETWSEGRKLLLFTSCIIQNFPAMSAMRAQCIGRCKSLTIWFMLMRLHFLLLSLHSISSFHSASIARLFRKHVLFANVKINGFLMSGAVSRVASCTISHWRDS